MYVIKSMKLAGYLMQKGFVLVRMDKDQNGSNRNIFLFKRSNKLMKAMEDYKKGE